ncbi:MAG TPA: lysophospholipid acyltransferase family protein, partial [Chthonomonadaceae bacterium]|nr:lysophospholipid acyltransferase family protein [Chthonomonadaceae bacterium]
MFPEGERTPDGNLQPALPGIALLVQRGGAPVVPVACMGTYAAWPKTGSFPRLRPLKIVFGKPMTFPPEAKREEVTAALMQAIADLMTAQGQPTAAPLKIGENRHAPDSA